MGQMGGYTFLYTLSNQWEGGGGGWITFLSVTNKPAAQGDNLSSHYKLKTPNFSLNWLQIQPPKRLPEHVTTLIQT